MALTLTSQSFAPQSDIPSKHTCEGSDLSPALAWSEVPAGTKTFALIVDDPDAPDPKAPKMTWVHWVLYDIPAATSGLVEGISPSSLPGSTRQGLNDWKQTGYRGPCPPVGRHRYFFKLYALDTELGNLGAGATKGAIEKAMAGHVLGKGELMGYYKKQQR